jgi:DNA-binding MarR family transcriptional regulator
VTSKGRNDPARPSSQADPARSAEVAGELEAALARLNQQTGLWQSFLAAHRQIVEQLAEEMLREHQLPLEWFDVLVHLADLPGMRAHQKELRDRVLLSESGVSRLLVRMEQAGLITRSTADDDRRSMEIAVTDDGRAALLAAIESHLQLVAELFSDRLTATDQAALSWVLSKLLAKATPLREAVQPCAGTAGPPARVWPGQMIATVTSGLVYGGPGSSPHQPVWTGSDVVPPAELKALVSA